MKQASFSLMTYLGSSANFDVTRILKSRKVVSVEGQDEKIIRRFAKKSNLPHLSSNIEIPFVQLGGFTRWNRAVDAIWGFKTIMKLDIEAIALFDRDYRCDEDVDEFILKHTNQGLRVLVLNRKEIENYLLEPESISCAVNSRIRDGVAISILIVKNNLKHISEELKIEVSSSRSSEYIRYQRTQSNRSHDKTLLVEASTRFEKGWACDRNRECMIPGKEVLSRLNKELQDIGFPAVNPGVILDNFVIGNIDASFSSILTHLHTFLSS